MTVHSFPVDTSLNHSETASELQTGAVVVWRFRQRVNLMPHIAGSVIPATIGQKTPTIHSTCLFCVCGKRRQRIGPEERMKPLDDPNLQVPSQRLQSPGDTVDLRRVAPINQPVHVLPCNLQPSCQLSRPDLLCGHFVYQKDLRRVACRQLHQTLIPFQFGRWGDR